VLRLAAPIEREYVPRVRRALFALMFACSTAAVGCDSFDISGPRHATLTYTEDARAGYEEAMASFRARDWEDAKALFNEVKRLFSYSRYARLAELRIADIEYEQEKFTDAIAAYRDFAQTHRADPNIEYAKYRVAKALFRDVDDTVFLPPAEERDQATIAEAYKELRNFLREFPKSRYHDDVGYMLDAITGRLVRHELYVARYYLKSDDFDATVARIDYALKTFPGSGLDAEALILKGETLMKMKKLKDAREVFESVKVTYGGPFAQTATHFLAEIDTLDHSAPKSK
jgi:outer membrane protein assembly factor BamD